MSVGRLLLVLLLVLIGCQTSPSGDAMDDNAGNTEEAETDTNSSSGDPDVTRRMAALIQPRDTSVVESPESAPDSAPPETAIDTTGAADPAEPEPEEPPAPPGPTAPPAYQGHSVAVSFDGTQTELGRMSRGGQVWSAGHISPTPQVRVQVIDPSLGTPTSIEIVIRPVVAGIISKTDFYVDERVKRTMMPGKAMTLQDFGHFLPDGGYERVEQLPQGAYRFVVLVLTKRPDGQTSWDRQFIDAVVPDS